MALRSLRIWYRISRENGSRVRTQRSSMPKWVRELQNLGCCGWRKGKGIRSSFVIWQRRQCSRVLRKRRCWWWWWWRERRRSGWGTWRWSQRCLCHRGSWSFWWGLMMSWRAMCGCDDHDHLGERMMIEVQEAIWFLWSKGLGFFLVCYSLEFFSLSYR